MIIKKVLETIQKYNLIDKGDKVLIGVSGGPDSVALLYLLNSLRKELKISLSIAHLDHMLRKDSQVDREFVKNLARRLKLPIIIGQISVSQLGKKGSLEEIARNIRFDFLIKTAKEISADKIALGHNLDDQAETVLMRILRGTGLQGLSAILPKKAIHGYTVIRPLLKVRRKDIAAFLKKRKIQTRLDKTNLDQAYFRNKIRRRLIPFLEAGYNGHIKEVLSNLAESAAQDYDYLSNISSRAIKSLVKPAAGNKLNLYLQKLLQLHPAIRRMVIRMAISEVKGNIRRITFKHMQEIEDLIETRPVNSVVDLPKGISVTKKKTQLSFCC